jgi:cold shock CspA family protein
MADKGKIIIINDGNGGIVEDSKTKTQYSFAQPNNVALCLNVGDRVKFDTVTSNGQVYATNVSRITAGVVKSFNGKGGGFLEERQTLKQVAFYQAFAAESGIDVGDVVRYDLINTGYGELAVNLVEVTE